jgi:hypothetical protein
MFSCEETWNVHLSFGRSRTHVRTFYLKLSDDAPLNQPAGTLWFRLPQNAGKVEYSSEGVNYVLSVDGLDRGLDVTFQNRVGTVEASFLSEEETDQESLLVNFRYNTPHRGWKKQWGDRHFKLIFHFPVGLPPNFMRWVNRVEFLHSILAKSNRLNLAASRLPSPIREYYFPPWGYIIDYDSNTLYGDIHGLLFTGRRLEYGFNKTRWMSRGQSALCFSLKANWESPFVAIIVGILLNRLSPIPVWSIIVILILIFPIFSSGLVWKVLHLLK